MSSISNVAGFPQQISPADEPEVGNILPIQNVFERLSVLIGTSFADPGKVQERNRGAALHRLVCQHLGYTRYEDNGKFPDIRHQLLEVKLQTSTTIDLGLVLPSSTETLDVQPLGNYLPRHCDTRYAIFQAASNGEIVTLTHLYVVWARFFHTFSTVFWQGTKSENPNFITAQFFRALIRIPAIPLCSIHRSMPLFG